ncbi:hypothetical protein EDD15DRAFT_2516122 [Pisolithus albus]|nr:hypothetical protein EDD15DRAFT_2516122 [Pisolithus albus]
MECDIVFIVMDHSPIACRRPSSSLWSYQVHVVYIVTAASSTAIRKTQAPTRKKTFTHIPIARQIAHQNTKWVQKKIPIQQHRIDGGYKQRPANVAPRRSGLYTVTGTLQRDLGMLQKDTKRTAGGFREPSGVFAAPVTRALIAPKISKITPVMLQEYSSAFNSATYEVLLPLVLFTPRCRAVLLRCILASAPLPTLVHDHQRSTSSRVVVSVGADLICLGAVFSRDNFMGDDIMASTLVLSRQ